MREGGCSMRSARELRERPRGWIWRRGGGGENSLLAHIPASLVGIVRESPEDACWCWGLG